MVTLQGLVDRLNQLTLRYNLTWDQIKYDADKAIVKINNYMGTKYPPMSEVLLHSGATYTINAAGARIEIFPEEYIHSVVIPYIAMEILARDEEFTTVYNKYNLELEEGLFHMFQKEFNRVPNEFRQDNDRGVFFEETSSKDKVARTLEANLPTFKLRVFYHANIDFALFPSSEPFVNDNTLYNYDAIATILGIQSDYKLVTADGLWIYEFAGWTRDPSLIGSPTVTVGSMINLKSDLHLFAVWDKHSTLTIDALTGTVSFASVADAALVSTLIIPERLNGVLVRVIPTNFTINASNLSYIELPPFLTTIKAHAFDGFIGDTIRFAEPITYVVPSVSIEEHAFINTTNLAYILIPASVTAIAANAFPVVTNKQFSILCRIPELSAPVGWVSGWYAASDLASNYSVNIVWGYDG